MDKNRIQLKIIHEECEVYQYPGGMIVTKSPGKFRGQKWKYRDNPWDGVGSKEHIAKLKFWDNTAPYEQDNESQSDTVMIERRLYLYKYKVLV
jgi:hypothetical protein